MLVLHRLNHHYQELQYLHQLHLLILLVLLLHLMVPIVLLLLLFFLRLHFLLPHPIVLLLVLLLLLIGGTACRSNRLTAKTRKPSGKTKEFAKTVVTQGPAPSNDVRWVLTTRAATLKPPGS